jgi:hypothetical protein
MPCSKSCRAGGCREEAAVVGAAHQCMDVLHARQQFRKVFRGAVWEQDAVHLAAGPAKGRIVGIIVGMITDTSNECTYQSTDHAM